MGNSIISSQVKMAMGMNSPQGKKTPCYAHTNASKRRRMYMYVLHTRVIEFDSFSCAGKLFCRLSLCYGRFWQLLVCQMKVHSKSNAQGRKKLYQTLEFRQETTNRY